MSAAIDEPVLDLSRYHTRREVGDLIIFTTWYGARLDLTEACLVITPARHRHFKPCIILMSEAWRWEPTIGDPEHSARMAGLYLQGLGMVMNKKNVINLMLLIHSCLGDLLSTPPKPVTATRDIAEATITTASGKKKTLELKEDV